MQMTSLGQEFMSTTRRTIMTSWFLEHNMADIVRVQINFG
jgi:hypothetical protein